MFVDLKKAFDSVHRKKMMEILHAYGVPDENINAIIIFYTNTRAQVLSPDGDTAHTLAPSFFYHLPRLCDAYNYC